MREKTEGTSERRERGKDNQVTGTYRSFGVRGTKTIRITVFTKDAQHKATAPVIYPPKPTLDNRKHHQPGSRFTPTNPKEPSCHRTKKSKDVLYTAQVTGSLYSKYIDLKTSKNRLVFAASPVGVLDLRLTEKGS